MNQYEFDPNNAEHLLERADALAAKEERAPVDVMSNTDGTWFPRADGNEDEFLEYIRYRRAPKPVVKWWSEPSHVPCPCWISNGKDIVQVDHFTNNGFQAGFITVYFSDLPTMNIKWAPTHNGPFVPCTVPLAQ